MAYKTLILAVVAAASISTLALAEGVKIPLIHLVQHYNQVGEETQWALGRAVLPDGSRILFRCRVAPDKSSGASCAAKLMK